jgi:hemerythrin-like domain-containing protein
MDGGVMGDPNDVLRAEHEAIELLLAAVEGMAARLHSGAAYPRRDLEKAMTVVTEFADRCHHAKEEKVLFPVLTKASPAGAEISRRLMSDHRAFRKLVGATRELIPKGEADPKARASVAKNLDTYTRVLREHILIENTDLFQEVERSLTEAQRAEIAKEFERVEQEEIGPGVHEQYHHMIHELADAYAV